MKTWLVINLLFYLNFYFAITLYQSYISNEIHNRNILSIICTRRPSNYLIVLRKHVLMMENEYSDNIMLTRNKNFMNGWKR